MIKFKQGCISNMNGESKDVVVSSASPNNLWDSLIGGGMVVAGIIYLTTSAFRNGSKAHEKAEYQTMVDLGIITE